MAEMMNEIERKERIVEKAVSVQVCQFHQHPTQVAFSYSVFRQFGQAKFAFGGSV